MLKEVLEFAGTCLGTGSNLFVDCTTGEGGHSEALLENFKELLLIGFERDHEILEIARQRLLRFGSRIELINDNFANLPNHLSGVRGHVSGFLYDFGISSFHFDKSGKGFSFSNDEILDMRLDGRGISASEIVNSYPESKLEEIFYVYGEERWAKKIAKKIYEERRAKKIGTTGELADIITSAIPKKFHVRNIHPATRVFQAIRIEVNDELNAIRNSLNESYKYLAAGGVIIAISFHSLEDRIVKDKFRRLSKGCLCDLDSRHCCCMNNPVVSILTKKPLRPSEEEMNVNRRSRSARLRACVKL